MEKKKDAKFFCENCGSEVKSNARFCPKCGKFFASVRCPQCGKMGSPSLFKKGCPRCHYAMPDADSSLENAGHNTGSDGLEHKLSRKSKKSIARAFESYGKNQEEPSGDIPSWLLIASLVTLVIVFTAVIFRCR